MSPDFAAYRVFPWDPSALPGAPFSPEYIPPAQGPGRFDLRGSPLVLYLAESPVHAIAEVIQGLRLNGLAPSDLKRSRQTLSVVEVTVRLPTDSLADLCDPRVLVTHGIRPDQIASKDYTVTQSIARKIYDAGLAGLRWWSFRTGDRHTVVLFTDRLDRSSALQFGAPVPLTIDTPEVREAARILGIRI